MALAIGAPWGAAAWGGGHSGVLPDQLRVASGVAAVVLAGVAAVAADRPFSGRGRRWVLLGMGIYAGAGIIANGMSASVVERAVWAPLSALGAVLALKAWREAVRAAE